MSTALNPERTFASSKGSQGSCSTRAGSTARSRRPARTGGRHERVLVGLSAGGGSGRDQGVPAESMRGATGVRHEDAPYDRYTVLGEVKRERHGTDGVRTLGTLRLRGAVVTTRGGGPSADTRTQNKGRAHGPWAHLPNDVRLPTVTDPAARARFSVAGASKEAPTRPTNTESSTRRWRRLKAL